VTPKRVARLSVGVLAAVSFGFGAAGGPVEQVGAAGLFHGYSYGSDSGRWVQGSSWYSGISVVHYDPYMPVPPDPQCGMYGTHPVAYETMWLAIDPYGGTNLYDWVEGGTVHQNCPDGSEYKAWYSDFYVWNPSTQSYDVHHMSKNQIGIGGQARFFLVQGNSNGKGCGTTAWNFFVAKGGAPVEYGCYPNPNLGYRDEMGLETWDDTCSPAVGQHTYVAALDSINWGAWQSWLPDGGTSGWLTFDDYPQNYMGGAYTNTTDGWAQEIDTC
jgi:hypothetical protein